MAHAAKGYEFFDHTADVGIRAQGATLGELCIRMAHALTELIAEDSALKPTTRRTLQLFANDETELLLVWLRELLFWFSTDRFIPVECQFDEVNSTTLRGVVRGDIFDASRHTQGREVKAITRHMLEVRRQGGQWRGQVIVDI